MAATVFNYFTCTLCPHINAWIGIITFLQVKMRLRKSNQLAQNVNLAALLYSLSLESINCNLMYLIFSKYVIILICMYVCQ